MALGPYWAAGLRDRVATVQAGRPAGVVPREPLHWPLAFPEVFADAQGPGFDAVIGNPPFVSGQDVSRRLGSDYLSSLQTWEGRGRKGSADLAARFVLRAEALLGRRGQLGFIATNTLAQGATLRVGLEQAVDRGLKLRRANSSHQWPSKANLEIVDVWASKAPLAAGIMPVLNGEEVPEIGPDLEPVGRLSGRPAQLTENQNTAFQGSIILGMGFTMSAEEAARHIASDSKAREVLFPYLGGQDICDRPDATASRWVINFHDWTLERAEEYGDLLDIVRREVKPERDKNAIKDRRELWWRYIYPGVAMHSAIRNLKSVLALAWTSSYVMPVRVARSQVFSNTTVVFAKADFATQAFLSSSPHAVWVIRYASTLETRIRYATSDVFLTLPRPAPTNLMHDLVRRGLSCLSLRDG